VANAGGASAGPLLDYYPRGLGADPGFEPAARRRRQKLCEGGLVGLAGLLPLGVAGCGENQHDNPESSQKNKQQEGQREDQQNVQQEVQQ
jgi:hypothetical protein